MSEMGVSRVYRSQVVAATIPMLDNVEKYYLVVSGNRKNETQETFLALKLNSKKPPFEHPTILQVPKISPHLKESLSGWIDCGVIFEIYTEEVDRVIQSFPPVFMDKINAGLKIIFDLP